MKITGTIKTNMQAIKNKHSKIVEDNMAYTLFSWSKQGGLNPLDLESAKGSYLYDSN